jgi:hypothetical protein
MQFQHRAASRDRSGINAIDELIDAIQKYFDLMYDCHLMRTVWSVLDAMRANSRSCIRQLDGKPVH